jgi:L-amino acid N-acyltransferase YncA
MMEIKPMQEGDEAAVNRFVGRIPERDRTFFKEDVTDPGVIKAWARPGAAYSLAVEDGEVIGSGSVVPLHGWSSHVGEVRVIVDPAHRGKGVGRALARQAVVDALRLGLTKMVVEVTADEDPTIGMFRSLGFDPEALLADHVRDNDGELHDLMILAHSVEAASAALQASGLGPELN